MPNLSICLSEFTVKVNHKSCENMDNNATQPGGEEHVPEGDHPVLEKDVVKLERVYLTLRRRRRLSNKIG